MTKEELLSTTFDSVPDAMHALEEFLKEQKDNPLSDGPGKISTSESYWKSGIRIKILLIQKKVEIISLPFTLLNIFLNK